jgi:glycosyltransferase involved in cell wall biosynthesis
MALFARLLTRARLIGSMRAMPDPHQLVPRRRYLGFIPGLQLWHLPEWIVGWMWGRILHRTVTVNARDFSARLIRHYGYRAERISVIYNGIDVNAPRVSAEGAGAHRRQNGIADNDFLVALVGRLSEEKGAHLLLEAIAPLQPRVRVVLVGDGPQRAELETLTDRLGLRPRVLFAGYTPRPETWMAAADVVAVPSTWYEAFGRVVVEAMNQGTAVVASRIGGMAELFDDGAHGRYVEAGSVEGLRAALRELAGQPALVQRMGEQARRLMRERYSLERVEAEYAEAYRLLAGQRPAPASAVDRNGAVSR